MTGIGSLRRFTGNPDMGWKVAWSDRMVYMYSILFLFSLLWKWVHRHLPALPLWGFGLFFLPLALDGTSHLIGEVISGGIGQGFRYDNAWLVALTQQTLPANFYLGDGIGSFNSLMRLLSGIFFGAGFAWFLMPFLDDTAQGIIKRYQNLDLLSQQAQQQVVQVD